MKLSRNQRLTRIILKRGKDCPFCGGRPDMWNDCGIHIACKNHLSNIEIFVQNSIWKAIRAWNTRPQDTNHEM